eukprot:628848-Pleurochrysis_carterae.AAC.1
MPNLRERRGEERSSLSSRRTHERDRESSCEKGRMCKERASLLACWRASAESGRASKACRRAGVRGHLRAGVRGHLRAG